jgi:hypothetical protein
MESAVNCRRIISLGVEVALDWFLSVLPSFSWIELLLTMSSIQLRQYRRRVRFVIECKVPLFLRAG